MCSANAPGFLGVFWVLFFRPKRKHWGCRMSWKSQKRYPKSFPLYYGSAFAISLCYFMPQKGCNLLNSKLLWFGRKNNQPTLQTQNKYHPPPKKVPSPLFHANYPPWKQQVRTWKWIHFFNTSFLFGAFRPVFTGELVSFKEGRLPGIACSTSTR